MSKKFEVLLSTTYGQWVKVEADNKDEALEDGELKRWYYEMQDILIHNRELIKKYGERYHESQREVIDNSYKELMK